jgi:uncharacterized damage-inducible protein DinB
MPDADKHRYIIDPLEGYPTEIGRALWSLEDVRRATRRAVDGLEVEELDAASTEGENSIGSLLYHIAVIEADWLYMEVLEQESFPDEALALFPQDVRDDRGKLAVVRDLPLDNHMRRLDRTRELLLGAFQSISVEDYRRARSFPRYDVTPEWVIHHLVQHEAEHGGQIRLLRQSMSP